jgi:DNA-binding CsgD family transcriptional regulator/PAS domain-containing protein
MLSPDTGSADLRHRYVSTLQSALTLDEVTDAFMREGASLIPSDVHGLYQLDAAGNGVVGVRVSTPKRFLDAYEDYGRADDPVLAFATREKRPIDSSRVVSAQAWESCGARAALAVDGYHHSLEAPVLVAGTVYGTMNFARAHGRAEFSEQDLVSARFAGEQLGLAAERALRFELTGRRTSMLEHTLDCIPQPVILTDLDAQVLFRNRAARNTSAGTPDDPVSESIGEALDAFRTHGKRVHTRSVRRPGTGDQLITKSFHLSERLDIAVTLVFNSGGEQLKRLPAWNVLSRREQEIAELVAQGLTTKQIAERAFISENTVKQHLKRVFAKVDVHNRAELVQLVWAHSEHSGAHDRSAPGGANRRPA